jgi:hypothetical protein
VLSFYEPQSALEAATMNVRSKFLRLLGTNPDPEEMTRYKATMMAYGEGGENTFEFLGPPHLMEQPGDEVVEAFVVYMNGQGITDTPFRYELNGAVKHGEVLTAMGSLILKGRSFPFIAMIAPLK